MAMVLYTIVSVVLFAGAPSMQSSATTTGSVQASSSGSIQPSATYGNLPSASTALNPPTQTDPQTPEEIVNDIHHIEHKVNCNYSNDINCEDLVPAIVKETDKGKACESLKNYASCLDKNCLYIDNDLREMIKKAMTNPVCSGCGLLQLSILVVLFTASLHFLLYFLGD